ncbi:MAG: aminomethyl-transferring glycine dehydrogenase subunit GcvPB [Armatimonadota bacterium]
MTEPLIFELSRPGRYGVSLPAIDVPEAPLPEDCVRDDVPLPEVAEVDVMRHYLHLSQINYSIDTGFYPLGSCTMKYNPKVNEVAARMSGFADIHPLQPEDSVQGAMALMYELQEILAEIAGFSAVTLQPAAGAQGELTGVLMMHKYLLDRGETGRHLVLVPDSAHGTNPATTAMSGLQVIEVPSDARGNVDLEFIRTLVNERGQEIVGLMLTNPNTLGLFDEHVDEVVRLIHDAGGLVYGDGANFNALLGKVKPGEIGFDVMHYNLHKTFSTPHGGGGPGSGAVGVSAELAEYMPGPVVEKGVDGAYRFTMPLKSIGRVKSFYGNFGVLVRAYTYLRMLGPDGLQAVSENAVINANYLQTRLRDTYPVPHGDRRCMHEFVAQGIIAGAPDDIHTLDIAKRIIDYGMYPPTIYFPLIVPEALMIEPTETESKQTLDQFIEIMLKIAEEARTNPELLKTAPHNAPLRRLDEVRAARELVLCWLPEE